MRGGLLDPIDANDATIAVTRGRERPRAIAWFGFSAFWGHLRHLVASAIATENIDSRQWMVPDEPAALLARMVAVLAPHGAVSAPTLVEALGGEAWLDYVSDTGDDASVSAAVARLLAGEYAVQGEGGAVVTLPRGHVLFLGGDLAYPVATVREITRRLVDPWNRELLPAGSGGRVLLAVPGNHDWYDGLDGFARLCQAPCAFEVEAAGGGESVAPDEFPLLAWAEAFARGESVEKPRAMRLLGYTPVQRASYFRLPLAPGLDLWGVDRQLKRIDDRQRAYFRAAPRNDRLVVVPDPARAWGEARPHGVATLRSLGIDMARDRVLLLSGDIHHYERSSEGESLHVVAGGGGAFLHGARVASRGAAYRVDAEFPSAAASRRLLWRLPLKVASGGAGWLLLAAFAVGNGAALAASMRDGVSAAVAAAAVMSTIVAASTAMLVGWRQRAAWRVLPLCAALGALVGAVPVGVAVLLRHAGHVLVGASTAAVTAVLVASTLASTWLSGLLFGLTLTIVARLGLNHAQAYAALGWASHKHWLRIRVRLEAGRPVVDCWVLGAVDPVGASKPVLVEHFRWAPSGGEGGGER